MWCGCDLGSIEALEVEHDAGDVVLQVTAWRRARLLLHVPSDGFPICGVTHQRRHVSELEYDQLMMMPSEMGPFTASGL